MVKGKNRDNIIKVFKAKEIETKNISFKFTSKKIGVEPKRKPEMRINVKIENREINKAKPKSYIPKADLINSTIKQEDI